MRHLHLSLCLVYGSACRVVNSVPWPCRNQYSPIRVARWDEVFRGVSATLVELAGVEPASTTTFRRLSRFRGAIFMTFALITGTVKRSLYSYTTILTAGDEP